jgi:hypothetical protein
MTTIESSRTSLGDGFSAFWRKILPSQGLNRGAAWGIMILGALLAFEVFNFSTTEFALRDVLGDLAFVGLPWATVLAIAFCSMDFAGIARIFTPQQGRDEPAEVWYLFGAWLLAACFNAILTWWGVSVAIATRANSGSAEVLGIATLTRVVPVFVAVMVWVIRVLIIGTFSVAGDKLFSMAGVGERSQRSYRPVIASRAPMGAVGARGAASAGRPLAPSLGPAPRSAPSASHDYRQPAVQTLAFEKDAPAVAAAGQRGPLVR